MEIKCKLDATDDLCWAEGCVSGLRAAAHKPDTQPSAPHHTNNLKTKAPNMTGSNHLYNTLKLLMTGITVPETRWASNKICNKIICCIWLVFYFHRNLCANERECLKLQTNSKDTTLTNVRTPWWCHSRSVKTCRILCIYRVHISVHVRLVW